MTDKLTKGNMCVYIYAIILDIYSIFHLLSFWVEGHGIKVCSKNPKVWTILGIFIWTSQQLS